MTPNTYRTFFEIVASIDLSAFDEETRRGRGPGAVRSEPAKSHLETFDALKLFVKTFKKSPTVRELAQLRDRSWATVRYHLDVLEGFGYVKRNPQKHRGIEVLK